MKKAQKNVRDYEKIRDQLRQIRNIVKNTKDSALWSHEAAVRKKIKALKEIKYQDFSDYNEVLDNYYKLLDEISVRLLGFYNKKNKTDFVFEDIIANELQAYRDSGIISVLITSHIPELVAKEFSKVFPKNPKDEYPRARALKRKIVLHLGETNTGKTYMAVERLMKAKKGIYLAPLRILALENYEKLNREGIPCDLITGEEELLTENANHVCSTVEKANTNESYDVAVIDEIQMIGDMQRGHAWTKALLGLRSKEIHVCGALNAKELIMNILSDCGDEIEIFEYKRQTPLQIIDEPFSFKSVTNGDALVAFSKKRVLELSKYFTDKGVKNSVIYGDLPPEVRRMQYHSFLTGASKILITTDAIGMGVNLPIRRIIFTDLSKFDGDNVRYLTSQEVKQIAGRAGRKGIYETGYVASFSGDSLFLTESIELPDEPIEKAVLGPSEIITTIPGLPLKEKVALWSTREESSEYYKKMDVRDYLLILESINYLKLPEVTQYKLMKLPFDVNDSELLMTFTGYAEEVFRYGQKTLFKPTIKGSYLFDYEKYYLKLNLYYSFSKNFELDFDPEWVYEERKRVSKKINSLLLRL